MTATAVPTLESTTPARRPAAATRLWPAGLLAGVAAAAATVAVAAGARALGISLETAPGQAIPVLGFGQLTLFFTAIGVLIAHTLRRRARRPRSTFTRTAMGLVVLSVVPDVVLSTDAATKLTLVLTHLVAAALVVPALSSRLPARGAR